MRFTLREGDRPSGRGDRRVIAAAIVAVIVAVIVA